MRALHVAGPSQEGQWEQTLRQQFLTAQPVLVKSRPIFEECFLALVAGVQQAGDVLYNTQAPDEILPLQQGLHPLQLLLFHDGLRLHAVRVSREQLFPLLPVPAGQVGGQVPEPGPGAALLPC